LRGEYNAKAGGRLVDECDPLREVRSLAGGIPKKKALSLYAAFFDPVFRDVVVPLKSLGSAMKRFAALIKKNSQKKRCSSKKYVKRRKQSRISGIKEQMV